MLPDAAFMTSIKDIPQIDRRVIKKAATKMNSNAVSISEEISPLLLLFIFCRFVLCFSFTVSIISPL